jgi:hypothetical protein
MLHAGLQFHLSLPVQWQMPRGRGQQQRLSTVHMAQFIVNDVANGVDIWDCITEILFSRAHAENDPVSAFPDISAIASIPAGVPSRKRAFILSLTGVPLHTRHLVHHRTLARTQLLLRRDIFGLRGTERRFTFLNIDKHAINGRPWE